ncbi:MAG: HD-GYP domain-containing protein [Dehalococcoidia bacterium]|nr:HD-GYP domain-containing protein [Dehalococcoidia bacterium]
MLIFAVLLAYPSLDAELGSATGHFWIVSAVALLALLLAATVLVAARELPEARTFFLAMAFLSISGIFLVHGLGTSPWFPSHEHEASHSPASGTDAYGGGYGAGSSTDPAGSTTGGQGLSTEAARGIVVGYSALLSLFVSSVFFALAAVDYGERASARIVRYRTWIGLALLALVGVYGAVALWFPEPIASIPLGSAPIDVGLAAVATALLLFAGYRFWRAYQLALLPIQGAMAVAMGLLVEAQWTMIYGRLWHLSWWEYHVLMLAGFSLGVGSLIHQRRITGDLSAIIEGLFLRKQVGELREGDPRAVGALTAAVAAKDTETAGHTGRVGDMTVALGKRLWLPTDRADVLRYAGQLHDLGKIGVPNSILRKAGPLTDEEFEVMKQHTVRGWHIARSSGLLAEVAPIIRAHHERLDGRGYPDGLRGDAIPFEARIVAAADVWDALTSDRPYRAGMARGEAADIMVESAGPHLEPVCVEELLHLLGMEGHAREVAAKRRDLEREGRLAA